jgi:hypothetical protein
VWWGLISVAVLASYFYSLDIWVRSRSIVPLMPAIYAFRDLTYNYF